MILSGERCPSKEASYVRSYLEEAGGAVITQQRDLLEFIHNPNLLAPRHRILVPKDAKPYYSNSDAERFVAKFINDLPRDIRTRCFSEKLLSGPRRERVLDALRYLTGLTREELEGIRVKDVQDKSSGRAFLPGHVVYRVSLELKDAREVTFYLKAISRHDTPELQKHEGWENRPLLYRYDTFFHAIAYELQVSHFQNRLIETDQDPEVQAIIISQEVEGEMAHHLLAGKGERDFAAHEQMCRSLARWHALSDLFGAADRRLQVTPHLKRDSNFIVSTAPNGMVHLEAIDHELIFSPRSCLEYGEEKGFTELEYLTLFEGKAFKEMSAGYLREYLSEAKMLRSLPVLAKLFSRTRDAFGAGSIEMALLTENAARDPEAEFLRQYQRRFPGESLSLSPLPAPTPQHFAEMLGLKIYDKRAVKGGAQQWQSALQKIGRQFPVSVGRSFYQRIKDIARLGLAPRRYIHSGLTEFLEAVHQLGSPPEFSLDEKIMVFFEPEPFSGWSIRKRMTLEEGICLGELLAKQFPALHWTITALPAREIVFQGNVIVDGEGSVHGEFLPGTEQPSRSKASSRFFKFETPRFLSVFPHLSTKKDRFPEVVKEVLLSLPRSEENGRLLEGYYEVAVGRASPLSPFELYYQDYWPD